MSDEFKVSINVHATELMETKESLVKFKELCAALKVSLDSRDVEVKTTKAENDELKRELTTLRIKTK